jgi:hypothetical protein
VDEVGAGGTVPGGMTVSSDGNINALSLGAASLVRRFQHAETATLHLLTHVA